MQRGSLKALLAVLAVAGYQNRDRITEILKGLVEKGQAGPRTGPQASAQAGTQGGAQAGARTGWDAGPKNGAESAGARPTLGGSLDEILDKLRSGGLGSVLGASGIGALLNGGLSDLLDQFKQAGQEKKADSWVKTGANEPINDSELQDALGADVLRDVAAKTGLSEEEVLRRLSKNLPDAVDGLTPDGTVPPAATI